MIDFVKFFLGFNLLVASIYGWGVLVLWSISKIKW